MALDGLDVGRTMVVLHWVGMLLGLGAAGVADALGMRMLLTRAPGPSRGVFTGLHVAIGLAILLLLFSGTGLMVLRADQWCELPANVLRLGPVCLPYKLAVKLTLMLTLVGVALLIETYLLPLSRRRERPLLTRLSLLEVARAAAIGSASATCWLSLAAIPQFKSLHSMAPLELLEHILLTWAVVASLFAIGLTALRFWLRSQEGESVCDGRGEPALERTARLLARRARTIPAAGHRGLRLVPASSPPQPVHADPLEAAGDLARRTLLGALAISFVINLLMLTGPLYMLQVYDRVLTSRSVETLTVLTGLVVGLFAVMGALDIIRSRIVSRLAIRLDAILAAPLLASAVRVAPNRPSQQSPLRDLEQIRQFVSGAVPTALLDLPWAPVYFAIVFLLHPLLGLVALAGAVALVGLSVLSQVIARKPLARAAEGTARCDAMVESGRLGAETLQAMGMVEPFKQRCLGELARTLSTQQRAHDIAGAAAATSRVCRLLLQSLLLGTGAWLALHDAMSAGAMIAASIIAGRALAPIEQLVAQWRSIGGVRGAVARCRTTLAALSDDAQSLALPRPRGALSVTNLYITPLGGTEPVVKGLNFRLEPGDALAIIGPSAAGKSTLARALVGVWPLRHGEIRLDGAALDQWSRREIGRHIGYMPQDVRLFDGTIAENIARLDPTPDPQAVLAAAQAAGVHEMILRLERGYETQIAEGGSTMAGGQRQRIALARALYGAPALVVMDEPNANLDSEGETALAAAISGIRSSGRTAIVISHRRSALAAVNLVLVLKEGRQIAFGPPAQVLRSSATVRKAEAVNDNKSNAGVGSRTR